MATAGPARIDTSASIPAGLRLLDRYTVRASISRGAMGAVYRAHDAENDCEVALKRLTDRRHAARFDIEARLLAHLRHPRVVEVVDYFHDDSGKYLVMELVEGVDLGGMLKKKGNPGLPIDEAIEYARQACEALQYVHDQQIVHRDVKPQNLIVSEDGVVLVDFGIARELGDEDQGTVGIGTPRYMAPEVFAGGNVSPRSDVFGLAATLWTLIAGKPPVYADPTPISEVVPEVPPELEQTIQAGLEMIPERRVASVAAFARALGARLAAAGDSLALSVDRPAAPRDLMEGIVKTAAGVFQAAASSIALTDETTGELVYQSAWGAGAREIVGVRLQAGMGIAGAVVGSSEGQAVADCRTDPRFAAQIAAGTGHVPYTMLVVPLRRENKAIGAMSLLDRRDGESYTSADLERAALFAELAVTALDVDPGAFTSLGVTSMGTGGAPFTATGTGER
jgi:eukaryotic-like serine/threonine-protein kinase